LHLLTRSQPLHPDSISTWILDTSAPSGTFVVQTSTTLVGDFSRTARPHGAAATADVNSGKTGE